MDVFKYEATKPTGSYIPNKFVFKSIFTTINYKDFSNILTKLKNSIFLKQMKKNIFQPVKYVGI